MKGWIAGMAMISGLVLGVEAAQAASRETQAAPIQKAQAASVHEQYDQSCGYCHTSGAAGAPKKGDVSAWKPRLEKGMDTLVKHVKEGYKAMPPRGLCGYCSEQDFRSLIEYMTSAKTNK